MQSRNYLLVSNYPSDTGYAWWLMERFWIEIGNRKGCNKAFIAYPLINEISPAIKNSNLHPIELSFNLDDQKNLKKIMCFIRENSIEAIYLTDATYFHEKYALLRLAGVKYIINHDHTPGDRPAIVGFKGLAKALRNRLSIFCADAVFNVSPLMKARSIENGRIPKDKIFSIQNGIQNVLSENKPANIRTELKINEKDQLIITSGRLHPYKRIDHCINIFEKCIESTPNLHLLILGDGPDKERLKSVCKKSKKANNIHFLGFRSDVRNVLTECDLAIHCAQGEGFSLSIIEYMNSGLPVITPDIPSVSQAITDGVTGYIFEDGNFGKAAEMIILLLTENKLREKFSNSAKETVANNYTLNQTILQFDSALTRLGI